MGCYDGRIGLHLCVRQRKPSCTGERGWQQTQIRWKITRHYSRLLFFVFVCQVFQSDGSFIGKFGTCGKGEGNLEHPHYIAVSNTNRVIVSDSNNHRIQIFDVNGRVLSSFGTEGSEEGQFKFPRYKSNSDPLPTAQRNYDINLIRFFFNFSTEVLGSTTKVLFVWPIRATIAYKFSIQTAVFCVHLALGDRAMPNSRVLKALPLCRMATF